MLSKNLSNNFYKFFSIYKKWQTNIIKSTRKDSKKKHVKHIQNLSEEE